MNIATSPYSLHQSHCNGLQVISRDLFIVYAAIVPTVLLAELVALWEVQVWQSRRELSRAVDLRGK